jgi:hypothetical protein
MITKDTDRHAHLTLYTLMQVLTPLLQLVKFDAVEVHEALINRIAEIGGCLFSDDAHYPTRQFPIEFIVRGKDSNLIVWELLFKLEIRRALLHSHRLGLVATSHDTAIIVA